MKTILLKFLVAFLIVLFLAFFAYYAMRSHISCNPVEIRLADNTSLNVKMCSQLGSNKVLFFLVE